MKIDNIYILFLKKSPSPGLAAQDRAGGGPHGAFRSKAGKGAFISWIVYREALLSAAASTKLHHLVAKGVNAP